MPQRSPTHEPPLAAIAHNIGLAHALAPTSTDDFPAGAGFGVPAGRPSRFCTTMTLRALFGAAFSIVFMNVS
jgi:hypothetical protein